MFEYKFKNAEGQVLTIRGTKRPALKEAMESVKARGYDRVESGGNWRPWTVEALLPVEGK